MAGWSSPPLVVSTGERKRWGASQLSVLARAHAQCCTCSEGSKSNEQDDADVGTGGSQSMRLGGSLLAVCLWLCWLGWLSWCHGDGDAHLVTLNGSSNGEGAAIGVLVILWVYFIPGDWLLS